MKLIRLAFLLAHRALVAAECVEIDGDWIRPQDLAKVFGVPVAGSARPLALPPWGVPRTVRRADLAGLGFAAATVPADSACFVRASMLVSGHQLATLSARSAGPVTGPLPGGPWRVPRGDLEVVPLSAGTGVRFAVRYGKNRYFFGPSIKTPTPSSPLSHRNCRSALPVGRWWLVVEGHCILDPRSQRWNVQGLNRTQLPAGRIPSAVPEAKAFSPEVLTHAP